MQRFVPARQILKARHMEQLAFCEACGVHEETIQHGLFGCTWVKIWTELRSTAGIKVPTLRPRSLALDLIDDSGLTEEHTSMILCGCWVSWIERNTEAWRMQPITELGSMGDADHHRLGLGRAREREEHTAKKKEC